MSDEGRYVEVFRDGIRKKIRLHEQTRDSSIREATEPRFDPETSIAEWDGDIVERSVPLSTTSQATQATPYRRAMDRFKKYGDALTDRTLAAFVVEFGKRRLGATARYKLNERLGEHEASALIWSVEDELTAFRERNRG
jgi:hypothetical protein